MIYRHVGDTVVSAIGFGAMHLSFAAPHDDMESVATIHAALDVGITLLDTARAYTTLNHESHNEYLVGRALRSHPAGSQVLIATKGGHYRSGPSSFPIDARPKALRADCLRSLQALNTDVIGLYQLHWPDPKVPISESVGELALLKVEGKVQHIGVCNVSLQQLEEARRQTKIDSVQNRFSPFDAADQAIVEYCASAGIAYLCHSPLGGSKRAQSLAQAFPAFARVARSLGVSTHQVALAWILAQSPATIPIPGSRRAIGAADSAGAADIRFTAGDLALLNDSLTSGRTS